MGHVPRLRQLAQETKESLEELTVEVREAEDIEHKLEQILNEDKELFELLEEEAINAREAKMIEDLVNKIEEVRKEVTDLENKLKQTERIFDEEQKEALATIQRNA